MRHELAQAVLATAREMLRAGLTRGTSGNVSARAGGARGDSFLITPSGMAYDSLGPGDLVELDFAGRARAGRRRPSSEWRLHAGIYEARADVGAIVHTHSVFATTLSTLRQPIPAVHYLITLAGVDSVPCADYATFGTAELAAACVRALGSGGACLLANHGLVAAAADLPSALRIAAELETLAELAWRAQQVGRPVVLDSAELARVRGQLEGGAYGQGGRGRRG